MNKILPKKLSRYQKTAVQLTAVLAHDYGSAYWVGGAVRDMLLGKEIHDIDIATAAHPTQIKSMLRKMKMPAITIGEKFGTIATTVDGQMIEITTYRREHVYSDKRHPDNVSFILDPKEDAQRRDFTVNALYFDPVNGTICDFVDGLKDLKIKKLRFVGNPSKRITEDPLRMLRAVRFATTLGFIFDKNTKCAIKQNAAAVTSISSERLTNELDKIITDRNYYQGIRLLDELGLLGALFPEIESLKKVEQSTNYHAEGNVFIHTMSVLSHAADNVPRAKSISSNENEIAFRYAALFHDVGKCGTAQPTHRNGREHVSFPQHGPFGSDIFTNIAKRLKFSTERRKRINYIISHHMDLSHTHDLDDKTMLAWMKRPYVTDLIRLRYADNRGAISTDVSGAVIQKDFSQLKRFEKRFLLMHRRWNKEFVTGDDVMRVFGLKQGREVGIILAEIRDQQALGKISSRTEALIVLHQMKERKNY